MDQKKWFGEWRVIDLKWEKTEAVIRDARGKNQEGQSLNGLGEKDKNCYPHAGKEGNPVGT